MQIFFTWPLFWMLLFVQVPLITMRVFSEEFKLGTIEMLLTAPVREWDVVLAKFFGALTFFLVLWLPIALDLTALQLFSSPRSARFLEPDRPDRTDHPACRLVLRLHRRLHFRADQKPDHRRRALLRAALHPLRHFALTLDPAYRRQPARLGLLRLHSRSTCRTPCRASSTAAPSSSTSPSTALMLYLAKTVLESRRLKG